MDRRSGVLVLISEVIRWNEAFELRMACFWLTSIGDLDKNQGCYASRG